MELLLGALKMKFKFIRNKLKTSSLLSIKLFPGCQFHTKNELEGSSKLLNW